MAQTAGRGSGANAGLTDWNSLKGHVCAIFRDLDEQYSVLMPFFRDGIERGERAFHTIDPARTSEHAERLRAGGIDVSGVIASGQLTINNWDQTFFDLGPWDNMQTVELFRGLCAQGRAIGYPRTRFFCEYEYAQIIHTPEEMLEYEATMQLHGFDRSNEHDASICSYQSLKWTGEVLINALRTHPTVILNGHIHENPFFQRPESVLGGLKRQQQACRCDRSERDN